MVTMNVRKKAVVALLALSVLAGGCGDRKTSVQKPAARPKSRPAVTRQEAVPVTVQPLKYVEQIDVLRTGLELDSLNGGIFVSPDGRLAAFSGSRVPQGEVPKGKEVEFEAKLVLADLVNGSVKMLDTAQYISIIEWSPTGGKVLYRRGDSQSDSLYTADVSGTEPLKIADRAYCGSFSPDGMKVAYVERGKGIFVAEVDGSDRKQLTHNESDWYPIWYPDGKSLFCFSGVGAAPPPGSAGRLQCLARINIKTGARENILPGQQGRFRRAAWIVAGKSLHLVKETADGFSELIADLEDEIVTDLGVSETTPDAFPPIDRVKGMVYKADAGKVAIYDTSGQKVSTLVLEPAGSLNNAGFSVSPDGHTMVFLAERERDTTGARLYKIMAADCDGSGSRELTGFGYYVRPVWTPGGVRIVTIETGGDAGRKFIVRTIPVDGKV